MKVCENCGREISTKDGENKCSQCTELEGASIKRVSRKRAKKERENCYKSLGLVKVKGSLGGTYWE